MTAARLFGLTGGVACGKSAVASVFREEGIRVIDADRVARDVVAVGSEGLAALVTHFGEGVVLPNGELDRKALGAIVFANPEERLVLNGLLHPRIAMQTAKEAMDLGSEGVTLACYEAALIVDNGMQEAFRPLVVVTAQASVQRERLMRRDGLSDEEAERRIRSQCSNEERTAAADFLIDNSGTEEELVSTARRVLEQVRRRVADESSSA